MCEVGVEIEERRFLERVLRVGALGGESRMWGGVFVLLGTADLDWLPRVDNTVEVQPPSLIESHSNVEASMHWEDCETARFDRRGFQMTYVMQVKYGIA
jgi:hypothetical protein